MIHTTLRSLVGMAAVVAAVAILSDLPAPAQQPELQPEPREGVLVLQNGEVLRGKITEAGDRYILAVPAGQVIIKASDVESCCASLEEAYRLRKQYHPCHYAQDHIAMAQWCQRHGLLEQAGRELAAAKDLDPTHPMIPLLERRIETTRKGVELRSPIALVPQTEVSSGELDRLVRTMPPGTMEMFTQTIQPLLVNQCTMSGCHGPGATGTFSLTRIPPSGPVSPRITQRNLHTVLQWVDRDKPNASPLLVAPLRGHGSAKAPIFTDRQADQYQQLVNWVYQVSRTSGLPGPVRHASHTGQLEPAPQADAAVHLDPALQPGEATAPASSEAAPASSEAVPAAPSPEASGSGPTMVIEGPLGAHPPQPPTPLAERPGVQRGVPIRKFVPADPFDPEIFNRRFFPTESSASDAERAP